jgi:hypothetical protein
LYTLYYHYQSLVRFTPEATKFMWKHFKWDEGV